MNKKKILWAPWRAGYVTSEKKAGCFLCDALKSRSQEREEKNLMLYRGEKVFIIMNLFPYNNGHLLLAPNRHIKTIELLKPQEERELTFLIKHSVTIMRKTMSAQGFNIGTNMGSAAGAGLDTHVHVHVVPRWAGDTNFMPVVSGTKVISQSMEELYRLLYPEFAKIKKCT